MDTQHLTADKFDYRIDLSRNSIIDKFILATSVFGVIYFGVTFWRDLTLGLITANSVVNGITALISTILWFARQHLKFGQKAAVLFFAYLLISVKAIILFGASSNSTLIFSCFCCIIIALAGNQRWSILMGLALSLIIPARGYLHYSGVYPVDYDFVERVVEDPSAWMQLYITFILTGAIIIFGTGQLRLEVNKYVALLQKSITGLESANSQLSLEIELKTAYQEGLLVSSKKFQSLFESSRDGVILLSSEGKVIEANQAICEITGYTLQDIRSAESIFQFIESPYKEMMKRKFQKQIRGEMFPELTEIPITRKNRESVQVEFNSNVILSENEVMIISTIRDISFRKQLENEKFSDALAVEERERERISKDLHDDLGPAFSTLNLYLQTLGKKETDPGKREVLDKLSDIANLAVKQVREISHNLSPYLLRDAGLVKAMETHISKVRDNQALAVEFVQRVDPHIKTPHNVEVVLYRIFLELLNNTIKHSGADRVRISLEVSSRVYSFIYIDNGKGFDISQEMENKSGIGLRNIENRVKSLGGTIEVTYQNNELTTAISIPS